MRVYDLLDDRGRVRAFEIDNANVGRREVCRLIREIPGAVVIKIPKLFSWLREEDFCMFTLGFCEFLVSEPFGDSSRYWCGPKHPGTWDEVMTVRQVFLDFKPSTFAVSGRVRRLWS